MQFKSKLLLFVVCLIALIVFQVKVVMPLVYEVIASDLFLKEDEPTVEEAEVGNQIYMYAFNQCNLYIANDLGSDYSVSYTSEPINTWALGDEQYVINAEIDILPEDGAAVTRRYVCRIKYTGDDFTPDSLNNPDDWSVSGISGIDEL